MSPSGPCTRKSSVDPRGFSIVEMLVALSMTSMVIVATAGFITVNRGLIGERGLEIETDVTARLVADVLARDLRLGGACLPVTGEFVSMDGVDGATRDEVVVRTGMTRDDLTCVRTATTATTGSGEQKIFVENTSGFETGSRVYLRGTSGIGEFLTLATVDNTGSWVRSEQPASRDYLATSGLYAVDERGYFIEETGGEPPKLMLQVNDEDPTPFATGIEALDIHYELKRNCPSCDVVDLPLNDDWFLVEKLFVSLTARSEKTKRDGQYYRRTIELAVKPRNLQPQ